MHANFLVTGFFNCPALGQDYSIFWLSLIFACILFY
jgi:hypothetical protein